MTRLRRCSLILALWALLLAACVAVIARTQFVADLSAFLPKAPNARQQMLVEQLRDGIIARLIMVGIEGGDAPLRARLSRELANQLRQDPAFLGVQNGAAEVLERDQAYYFNNRYLLSPNVEAARFTEEGLHQAIGNSIDELSGNAGMMLKRLLPHDPTGETLGLIEQFAGGSQPRSLEGVWASRDGARALMILQTAAAGSDTDGQAAAIARLRQAFDALPEKADARLLMSGAGVFSVSSRQTIEGEIGRLATAGTLLVVGLLLAIYRSPRLLILGMLPVVSGALAGIAAVSLGFGQVHGLTLAFGTTLIGEAVDYSIYLFIQRAGGHALGAFWRVIGLGVATSAAGFAVLLCSGFPGLAQLGLYSISGLVAATLVTRFVLPELLPAQMPLRDLSAPGRWLERAAAHAHRARPLLLVLVVAAFALLVWRGDSVWNRQLNSLSPVSAADQALDAQLRSDMGAPDMRYLVAFTAPDAESALQRAERLTPALNRLTTAGTLGGFNSPATVLPSQQTQHARLAALPEPATLRERLNGALAGLPLSASRLEGFLTDVEAARQRPLLTRADLAGTSSALLVDSLLVHRAHDYLVLMPLRAAAGAETIDTDTVETALATAQVEGATVIDLLEESTSLYAGYLKEALHLALGGGAVIALLLLLALRSPRRTLRVVLPLAFAVLCVAALLVVGGRQMTILHLVGLLLVGAVGSNYALFFDAEAGSQSLVERSQTTVSLCVANLTTVCSFGLLAASQVPVLSAIGATVGPGAFLALLFSAILARRHAARP